MWDPLTASRILTALTLSFHILFATIGVGVPLYIALAEWRAMRIGDRDLSRSAYRWGKGYAVTVALGVVTGTSIGLFLNLLWPPFMALAGQTIALPLFLETFAFFLEAIFLGLYLYTWREDGPPLRNTLYAAVIALGASASAFFITSVNAFMNTPAGARITAEGTLDVHPVQAMFSPATATKTVHVLLSAYFASAFVLAALSAYELRRDPRDTRAAKALRLAMQGALLFGVGTVLSGDFSGKFLAAYQPEKLAAAEWHFTTQGAAPLRLFGLWEDGTVRYALTIPYGLSVLAKGTPSAVVTGLDAFPPEDRPPLVVHYFFDLMVVFGFLLLALAAYYWWRVWRTRSVGQAEEVATGRLPAWFFPALVVAAPLSLMTVELGWYFAEMGRLPWIVRGIARVGETATENPAVSWLVYVFLALYVLLTAIAVRVLAAIYGSEGPETAFRRLFGGLRGGESRGS
ncbi:cytochrome ubiquinol oxidase subunit I [Brockia lithotrophica]|uniref:Cytochrome bd-I ubiquinol oxidase subunit 1 apoprotein n=1 Tax=Brockia lithotrophica TaxID=933949 RepID=A0A660L1J3_9BACL|nr:cytochrome ubiquinol oxidase subunit I [Brockia lithotrophica]RKQ85498.1 cytochrome bd-I ubiquinol oxidase subunit 1 apoprotein [Brockia lithotrophica]